MSFFFFKRCFTTTGLKANGTIPEFKEVFIKFKSPGPAIAKVSFKFLAGITSRHQFVGFSDLKI